MLISEFNVDILRLGDLAKSHGWVTLGEFSKQGLRQVNSPINWRVRKKSKEKENSLKIWRVPDKGSVASDLAKILAGMDFFAEKRKLAKLCWSILHIDKTHTSAGINYKNDRIVLMWRRPYKDLIFSYPKIYIKPDIIITRNNNENEIIIVRNFQ